MPPLFLLRLSSPLAPPFDVGDVDGSAAAVKRVMDKSTSWWAVMHAEKDDALITSVRYSMLIDALLKRLFARAEEGHLHTGHTPLHRAALMALGGYGRCEMGPHSDIDLLFVCEGDDESYISALTAGILYPLWDAGLDVTAVTRSLDDCRHVVRDDPRALTSMLDARFVAGDEAMAERFQESISAWFSKPRVRRRFVGQKLDEYRARQKKYGDSIYLLQPNVKEGEGGLRDFHTLVWLTRAIYPDAPIEAMLIRAGLSRRSVDELVESVRFIWRVRHALHLLEGKRQDRLGEEHQDDVASMLGFEGSSFSSAAEQLMRAYYKNAAVIHRRFQWAAESMEGARLHPILRLIKRALRRHISLSRETIEADPVIMLRAFVAAKKRRLRLDVNTKELITECAPRLNEQLQSSEPARLLWKELFGNAVHLDVVLSEMHECGCLEHWFPEMRPMIHRIQHDGFHQFTVDVHTLKAISVLSAFCHREQRQHHPVAAKAMKEIRRPHVVLLATLFHDIGKGHGGEHESVGAELAKRILGRMGFSEEDCNDVSFLVRSHMLMPKLAFSRDISQPALIERFAQTVRTPQMLAMLYLTTFADLRSVGPHIWNAWKEGLLGELYQRTRDVLVAGDQTEEQHKRLRTKCVRAVHRILRNDCSLGDVEEFMAMMPQRYALALPPPTIAAHLGLVREYSSSRAAVCDIRNDHERGVSELSVVTGDAPGLFARIAGVLTVNGINIVDAELYTNADGVAVDLIRMTDLHHRPIEDPVRWQRIIRSLSEVQEGNALDAKLAIKLKPRLKKRGRRADPRVDVDNDVSATETVLEVHADDRPGLLYRIAHVIAEHGCTIHRARITTHVDRVVDVFYIRNSEGMKITGRDQLDTLRDALQGELVT